MRAPTDRAVQYRRSEMPAVLAVCLLVAALTVRVAVAADDPAAKPQPKGGTPAGAKGDADAQKQTLKGTAIEKRQPSKGSRPSAGSFKCLVVFGLYTHVLRIDDALAEWRYQGKFRPAITWANCPPNGVEGFPGTRDELFGYHAVVLSDVNAKALGEARLTLLCDYVEQGGRLLVTGGPYAFGNGEFKGTRFLDLLPVALSGPFDLKRAGSGRFGMLEPAAASHTVLEQVTFVQKPRVLWHHFISPKPGAEVVLKAGDRPVLVLGRYGKGKVAALALSPTGEVAAGETAWWGWDGWPVLVRNVFRWLAE